MTVALTTSTRMGIKTAGMIFAQRFRLCSTPRQYSVGTSLRTKIVAILRGAEASILSFAVVFYRTLPRIHPSDLCVNIYLAWKQYSSLNELHDPDSQGQFSEIHRHNEEQVQSVLEKGAACIGKAEPASHTTSEAPVITCAFSITNSVRFSLARAKSSS